MATDNKYDRQLRLWGANGQKALMEAKICLINAGATGTEIMKNLVLPGCGYIYILDDAKVTARDCDNNFFVTREHIGRPRAEVTCELLLELNPDVKGEFRNESAMSVLASDAGFFSQFQLVIATQMPQRDLEALAKVLEPLNVPFISAKAFGLLGHIRLYSAQHRIIESKPSSYKHDLRIQHPFPALRAFADGFDLATLPKMEHKHVPFVVLLIKALDSWKAEHGGQVPKTRDEKTAFKASVAALERFEEEDNIAEAVKHADLAYVTPLFKEDVLDVLDDTAAAELTAASDPFWFIAAAIKQFHERHGVLPLPGELPDMTATTDWYIDVQRIFKEQAAREADEIKHTVQELERSVIGTVGHVPQAMIDLACKNSAHMRAIQGRSILSEASFDEPTKDTIQSALLEHTTPEEAEQAGIVWYMAIRAAEAFFSLHGRYPGAVDSEIASDGAQVHSALVDMCEAVGVDKSYVTEAHAAEITRFGASEPHVTAALLGGIGSQEAIKLITHQFVPLDNTFIYNGIAGSGATFRM